MMKRLNEILSEIGISKVKLAKYLNVSRQMVYNYLEMEDVNLWPLEKKMKLFNLLQTKLILSLSQSSMYKLIQALHSILANSMSSNDELLTIVSIINLSLSDNKSL